MNPLSIGKSIFVCLIKIINYLGYEKNDIHFMHSDRFAFGLLTIRNARQSFPNEVQVRFKAWNKECLPNKSRSKEYLWAGFVNSFPSSKGS